MSFSLCLPKISLSGPGCVLEVTPFLQRSGIRRPLLVTDPQLLKHGLVDALLASLREAGLAPTVFDAVRPNPTDHVAEAALAAFRESDGDAIIGFGGGSSIDTAKAVRALVANPDKRVHELAGVGNIGKCGPLLVAITTTAGTAAEVTSNAVITDTARHVKMVLIDAAIIPDLAVNDPELMLGLPASITAATGIDALTHAVEAYVSKAAHPLTDHSALAAIRLIARHLPQAVDDGKDLEARTMMCHGQFLAGMAFNSAGLGYVHSLAHQPGATHDLPHGVCNAILLPVVSEFNRPHREERFAAIAQAMGGQTDGLSLEEASKLAIRLIRELSVRVGIPKGFAELGVKREDIAAWIRPAQEDPCTGCAPVAASDVEVENLYLKAL
ncbi:iron-containing alcohol dehydrogenase [Niveibacterium terrae]|uniref:iron-containing alcohol dehydrogenase n=1 Tax=Niveibacterium terrae TaxID=3373598 RepID=UPI003A934346